MVTHYGAFTDLSHERLLDGVKTLVGTVDAWEVVVTGLDVPRPCSQLPSAPATASDNAGCPDIHTLTVIVDDKTGAYVEAVGT